MTIDKRLVAALRECKDETDIEDTFSRFGINEMPNKQRYLIWAMYAPSVHFSSFRPITENDIYQAVVQQFCMGSWRLYPLYEKLGIKKNKINEEDKPIFAELEKCTSKEDIDTVFTRADIRTYDERCKILHRYMDATELCGISGKPYDCDDYEFDCAIFLDNL